MLQAHIVEEVDVRFLMLKLKESANKLKYSERVLLSVGLYRLK